MMQQWADYLNTLKAGAEVIPLSGQAALSLLAVGSIAKTGKFCAWLVQG